MKQPEHTRKSLAAKTGLFATLSNLLRGEGRGTPSISPSPSSSSASANGAPSSRRLRKTFTVLIASALAITALLALTATPASAAQKHVFATTFGGAGTGNGQFENPAGLAVNDTTGSVYVTDKGNNRVQIFSATGTYESQFNGSATPATAFSGPTSIAVDNACQLQQPPLTALTTPTCAEFDPSAGDVYVYDSGNGVIDKFDSTGTYIGQIREAETGSLLGVIDGIATDPGGNLWVYQATEIDEFSNALPNGFLSKRLSPPGTSQGFAVDSADNLYVNRDDEVLVKLNVSGELLIGHMNNSQTTSAAVDLTNDHVYLYNQTAAANTIAAFDPAPGCTVPTPCAEAPASSLIETFGSAQLTGGHAVAVNASDGTLYATNTSSDQVVVYTAIITPDAITNSATEVGQTTAVLHGEVDPAGGGDIIDCHFAVSGGIGDVPCEQATPISSTGSVSAQATGLATNTTYTYRLIAANANGENEGQPQSFTTEGPPLIESESVSSVTATSATLEATINPEGFAAHYHFEYISEADYLKDGESFGPDAHSAPVPDQSIGAGSSGVQVSVHLQGLDPATPYRYRVAATSVKGEGEDEGRAFVTQVASAGLLLPDARQWEMVSPPDKQGADLSGIGGAGVIQASASGDAITYPASAPTEAQPQGNTNFSQIFSSRGPGGWGSQGIAPPHAAATGLSIGRGQEYRAFSEDLSLGVVAPFGPFNPAISPAASESTPFLHTDYLGGDVTRLCTSSCYQPLVSGCPPKGEPCPASVEEHADVPPGTVFGSEAEGVCIKPGTTEIDSFIFCGPKFLGATPDLSHIVLSSPAAGLTPGTTRGIYEWAAGRLTFIGEGGGQHPFDAISDDGSRVAWHEDIDGGHLYLSDTTREETVQLDAVHSGSGEGPARPLFQRASSDGSKVFFTDTQRLTADSGANEEGGKNHPDLYECEMVEEEEELKCNLSDLTPLGPGEESADVLGGVLGASQDGSSLYFVANGALAPGTVHGSCASGTSGGSPPGSECNLYSERFDGSQWEAPKLIAVLSGEDVPDWRPDLTQRTARVSPNGRWLAFMSQRQLTGYDNRDALSGKPDEEVYLYHAPAGEGEEGKLICASCNPTGARPHGIENLSINAPLVGGEAVWSPGTWVASNIPGWTGYELGVALYQSRFLSNSGRLFFNSSDAFVPQDSNRNEDVYQYEPAGVGDCTASSPTFGGASGGCVSLISSGASARESAFLDASQSGDDVFFLTSARLSAQDTDTSLDVYDAHACSASVPCLPPPPPAPPACTGDACQLPAVPPDDSTPGSLTFNGAGNLHESTKTHKKKHHKKRHRAKRHKKRTHGRAANQNRRAIR